MGQKIGEKGALFQQGGDGAKPGHGFKGFQQSGTGRRKIAPAAVAMRKPDLGTDPLAGRQVKIAGNGCQRFQQARTVWRVKTHLARAEEGGRHLVAVCQAGQLAAVGEHPTAGDPPRQTGEPLGRLLPAVAVLQHGNVMLIDDQSPMRITLLRQPPAIEKAAGRLRGIMFA